jgi:beta-galactosidase
MCWRCLRHWEEMYKAEKIVNTPKISYWLIVALLLVVVVFAFIGCRMISGKSTRQRHVISLNGTWEIAEGSMDSIPETFEHKVPVPGLVDMAEPAFAEVGIKSDKRQAFWYRRKFTVSGNIPEVALLKIHKAKYGTRVFLNGELIGDHLPCFTPALLNVRDHLKGSGAENEIIVRVGSFRDSVPESIPSGWDFEKYKYIPGIYDSVELILSGVPYIVNVQTVPDIAANRVRVITELRWPEMDGRADISYEVSEADTGRFVGAVQESELPFAANQTTRQDVTIPIEDCKLWTPEKPFLYELKVDTGGDCLRVRFGMRSF